MIHDVRQNSMAWLQLHVGRLTASSFERFITPKNLALSESQTAHRFLARKAMERVTGKPEREASSASMEHGHETEPRARQVYERIRGVVVRQVGFITLDEHPMIGCSPDGLVGDDGGLEIKSHYTQAEAAAVRLSGIPDKHLIQVLGNLWISGKEWWDYVSYMDEEICPDIRASTYISCIHRDDALPQMSKLADTVLKADAMVDSLHRKLLSRIDQQWRSATCQRIPC